MSPHETIALTRASPDASSYTQYFRQSFPFLIQGMPQDNDEENAASDLDLPFDEEPKGMPQDIYETATEGSSMTTSIHKEVRFAEEPAQAIEFEPIPGAEHFNIWFSRNDYYFMRMRDVLIVQLIDAGTFQESSEQTMRGLEHHLDEDEGENPLVKRAVEAVLDEQDRQLAWGLSEPEAIRQVYNQICAKCHRFARLLGQKDELDVLMMQERHTEKVMRRPDSMGLLPRQFETQDDNGSLIEQESTEVSNHATRKEKKRGLFRRWSSRKVEKQPSKREEMRRAASERRASRRDSFSRSDNKTLAKENSTTGIPAQLQEYSLNIGAEIQPASVAPQQSCRTKSKRRLFRSWSRKKVETTPAPQEFVFQPESSEDSTDNSAPSTPEWFDLQSPASVQSPRRSPRRLQKSASCKALRIESSISADYFENPVEIMPPPPPLAQPVTHKKKKRGLLRSLSNRSSRFLSSMTSRNYA